MLRKSWFATYWFFSAAIALVSLTAVGLAAAISFPDAMPHLAHYTRSLKLPLYAHVLFGPLALAAAPFQFWTGLRTTRPRIHRMIGYTYATSILIAGLGALVMLTGFEGTTWAATGFLILDFAWLGSTAYAVGLARRRDFTRHRRWMMRSAAMTFAAVTLRIGMLPLLAAGWTLHETYNVTAWLSWLIPLAYVEWRLRRRVAQSLPVPAE